MHFIAVLIYVIDGAIFNLSLVNQYKYLSLYNREKNEFRNAENI